MFLLLSFLQKNISIFLVKLKNSGYIPVKLNVTIYNI